MFNQGSRYRTLAESSPIDAAGERLHGKIMRLIPRSGGSFEHVVRDGDRLDLLSFNYYGDSTKWWQIADANPQAACPTDLLDAAPMVAERFALTNTAGEPRYFQLIGELQELVAELNADAQFLPLASLADESLAQLEALQTTLAVLYSPTSFLHSTVVVIYPPSAATRDSILSSIKANGFHLLHADDWSAEGSRNIIESFSLDDAGARQSWQEIVRALSRMRGILNVASSIVESYLDVVYNSAIVGREDILAQAGSFGFHIQAQKFSRVGSRIIIPPNQIV